MGWSEFKKAALEKVSKVSRLPVSQPLYRKRRRGAHIISTLVLHESYMEESDKARFSLNSIVHGVKPFTYSIKDPHLIILVSR
jgi:hypothetical protein